MKKLRIAEPNYEFTVIEALGSDIIGKSFFTQELSILKCIDGEGIVSINSIEHTFKKNANFLLPDAMHFKVTESSPQFSIRACCFGLSFLNEVYAMLDNKVIDSMRYSTPNLIDNNNYQATDLTFTRLCLLHNQQDHAYRHRIAVNLVVNYILEIYELTHRNIESKSINKSNYVNQILSSFFVLCVSHHSQKRNIEFYANELNISSRYLSKITKQTIQSTPKRIIDYYVTGTIKKMLLTTPLSNQQIADQLNFADLATLGQFFKRNVGISLSDFKKRYR